MPCNCDHMEPSQRENASREVLTHLYDLGYETEKPGYYGRVETLDRDIAKLCSWCKSNPSEVSKQSLELQIWWRDHQKTDEKKKLAEIERQRKQAVREKALSKLTGEEKAALEIS